MAETRDPTLFESLVPVLFLIILLFVNVYWIWGADSLDGANQLALLFGAALASVIGIRLGHTWESLLEGMVRSISAAMPSVLILLVIGALAGTWLISGIVPAMIYYGLDLLSPTVFLVAACIISAVVSLATGSSWTAVATVGIALLAIGKTLGFSEGVIGGAIISGAYFGDKISPLSDTTNLAPAMAGTDLFTHIRYMMITTVPSLLIALAIYIFLGLGENNQVALENISAVKNAIATRFHISGWLFFVPALVILMIIRKVAALPALLFGSLAGGVFALIFQPDLLKLMASSTHSWIQSYRVIMEAMYGPISIPSDHPMVNELLSTGGMAGMLYTIWLILSAMVFGGVLERTRMLQRIASAIISWAHNTGSLIASTAATCLFFNFTASDQYLAIVVPGRMFAPIFRDRGLKPENLSRTLEDSGTVTSVLIPWNSCGATQSRVLGVDTLIYAPFAFFNIISPIMTILVAYFGIKIRYSAKTESKT